MDARGMVWALVLPLAFASEASAQSLVSPDIRETQETDAWPFDDPPAAEAEDRGQSGEWTHWCYPERTNKAVDGFLGVSPRVRNGGQLPGETVDFAFGIGGTYRVGPIFPGLEAVFGFRNWDRPPSAEVLNLGTPEGTVECRYGFLLGSLNFVLPLGRVSPVVSGGGGFAYVRAELKGEGSFFGMPVPTSSVENDFVLAYHASFGLDVAVMPSFDAGIAFRHIGARADLGPLSNGRIALGNDLIVLTVTYYAP